MRYLLLVATLIHCLPPKEKKITLIIAYSIESRKNYVFFFNNLSIELVLTQRKNCKFLQIYNQLNLTHKKFNKLKEK